MSTRRSALTAGALALALGAAVTIKVMIDNGLTPSQTYRTGITRLEPLTNQVLIKVRQSARAAVREGSGEVSGLAVLPSVSRVRGGATVTRVMTPGATSVSTDPVFQWYLVTLGATPTTSASASPRRQRERDPTARRALQQAMDLLRTDPSIEAVEPVVSITADVINDPYYSSSGAWGQGYLDLWPLKNIHAEEAWASTTGAGVTVAVIDTGVDIAHPDMAANVWKNPGEICGDGLDNDHNGFVDDCNGWNFVGGSSPMFDDFGHGTHVAGTIAALANDAIGISGVAPSARIMPVKALDNNGAGDLDDLASAIVYAADNGAKVINASWGGVGTPPQLMLDAVAYAHDTKGAVVVAAAGNSNQDIGGPGGAIGFYPANITGVISVGAVDHLDQRASFSNFGQALDLSAPGGGDADVSGVYASSRSVLSLLSSRASQLMTDNGQLVVGGQYLRQAGTSMAAPHVAGVAALVVALHPAYTPEQVRQVLRSTSDDVLAPGFDAQSGYGRLNAARAVLAPTPLAVRLSGPGSAATLKGVTSVTVSGTVSGPGLTGWTLSAVDAQQVATTIATSSSPATGALGTWALGAVPDGIYILRLSATSSTGQVYQDRAQVTVDNLYITTPVQTLPYVGGALGFFTPFKGGDTVTITGTVASAGLVSYALKVQSQDTGNYLTSPAITIPNGGTQPVRDGTIAMWNTTGVASGHYTIELNVKAGAQTLQDKVSVTVDQTLHAVAVARMPVRWADPYGSGGFYAPGTDHLVAVDVGGGKKGIVLYDGRTVDLLGVDGKSLPGWPQALPMAGTYMQLIGPTVADVDGDGKLDVIGTGGTTVVAWKTDGTKLWQRNTPAPCAHLSADDLYGDGKAEVVCVYPANLTPPGLVIIDPDGTLHPVSLPARPDRAAIGDVDGDGKKEIVLRSQVDVIKTPIYIVVVGATGVVKQNIMVTYTQIPSVYWWVQNVALGDVDGDGVLDIVTGDYDGRVLAYHGNGTPVAGWPKQVTSARQNPLPAMLVALTPVIADLDGDGKNDVVVPFGGQYDVSGASFDDLVIFSSKGTTSQATVRTQMGGSVHGFAEAVLADVDGDGKADIVASSDTLSALPFALTAYHADGTAVPGFPKLTAATEQSQTDAPLVADLDGDGKLNLVWVDFDGNVYIWDLPSSASAPQPWPMFGHDAGHTSRAGASTSTGSPTPPPPPPPVPLSVAFTSPTDGQQVSGVVSVVFGAIGSVTSAQLMIDGGTGGAVNFGGAPYSYTWDTSGLSGQHTLKAQVSDGKGASASASIKVTIADTTAPTLSVIVPATGVVGQPVTISALASDASGIANVKFGVNGATLGTDTTAPYSVSWTPPSAGMFMVLVTATDVAGNTAALGAGITVTAPAPPPQPASLPVGPYQAAGAFTDVRPLAKGQGVETTGTGDYTWTVTSAGTAYTLTVNSAGALTLAKSGAVLKTATLSSSTLLRIEWTGTSLRIVRGSTTWTTVTGVNAAPTIELKATRAFTVK